MPDPLTAELRVARDGRRWMQCPACSCILRPTNPASLQTCRWCRAEFVLTERKERRR